MTNYTRSKQDWQVTKTCLKERFKELMLLSQWTHCTFSVGEEQELIKCHKLVLAVSSPVFEALFYGGFSLNEDVIKVPDIEPYVFKQFLNYIYSDSLDLKNVDDAGGLLYTAKKYLMPQLARICTDYLLGATGIKTMWDVLLIAEELNEEELLSICLKVMVRYPYEVWCSDKNHMSKNTLSKLLEQTIMNMQEIELWKLVMDWCHEECRINGIKPSGKNIRSIMESMGILKKFRFLSLSYEEFSLVKESGILDEEECERLKVLIEKKDLIEAIPESLCQERTARLEVKPLTWRCHRESLGGECFLTYAGPMETKIKSQSRVLIMGFEFVTRSSTISYPCGFYTTGNFYKEKIHLSIKDENGKTLSAAEHNDNAEFNSFQTVYLNRPLWFEAGSSYTVHYIFPTGNANYPLSYFPRVTACKGTTFEFKDSTVLSNYVSRGSFITSILYSI